MKQVHLSAILIATPKSAIHNTVASSKPNPPDASDRVEVFYGRRRSRPKASTVHGWLVKWRATFSGNERLRKEGIREMREAKAVREWKKQRRAARRAKAGASKSLFRLWPILLGRKRRPKTSKALSRVSSTKRPGRSGTQPLTSPPQSPRPTPANSRRSSHMRQGTPQNSRKTSHDSRRDTLRTAEKRRR